MTDTSLSDRLEAMKGSHQTKREALNAKLRQAKSVAKIAVHGNPSEEDIFHALWCVLEMLEEISKAFEAMTPQDFEPKEDGVPMPARNPKEQDA